MFIYWYEAHGLGQREMKTKRFFQETMGKKRTSRKAYLVVCLRNDGYPASLETRKIYRALTDESAGRLKCVRVIDESGEDYLYPTNYFAAINLPATVERELAKAG